MASYDQRELDRAASNLKLQEVAELGQSLGLWTVTKTTKSDGDAWRFVNVVTPDGLHFDISGGSWNTENKIHASVGGVRLDDGIKADERDIRRYSEPSAPDAFISKDKTAAQIIKDIKRRVIDNPVCIDYAKRINERIGSLKKSQAGLAKHIQTLTALGFQFRERDASKTHSAQAYRHGLSGVTIYDNGRVNFEASLPVEDIPALLALLGDRK